MKLNHNKKSVKISLNLFALYAVMAVSYTHLRAKGERPSVRMELSDITAYLRRKVEPPKDRMPKMPVKIKRKDKVL